MTFEKHRISGSKQMWDLIDFINEGKADAGRSGTFESIFWEGVRSIESNGDDLKDWATKKRRGPKDMKTKRYVERDPNAPYEFVEAALFVEDLHANNVEKLLNHYIKHKKKILYLQKSETVGERDVIICLEPIRKGIAIRKNKNKIDVEYEAYFFKTHKDGKVYKERPYTARAIELAMVDRQGIPIFTSGIENFVERYFFKYNSNKFPMVPYKGKDAGEIPKSKNLEHIKLYVQRMTEERKEKLKLEQEKQRAQYIQDNQVVKKGSFTYFLMETFNKIF
jgi:hypothetical protein